MIVRFIEDEKFKAIDFLKVTKSRKRLVVVSSCCRSV